MAGTVDAGDRDVSVSLMVHPRTRPLVTIVDDNIEDLFLIERTLGKAEVLMEVMPFTCADEARNFLQNLANSLQEIPKNSVLLSDIRMPGTSGFDLIEWIRTQERLKPLRLFFLTGSNETKDRERAKKLQVEGYCIKFPTPDVFRRILENSGPVAACDV